jgi:hypothetical protein
MHHVSMRKIFALPCFFIVMIMHLNGQKKFIGNYRNYFGERMEIYPDSTFKYSFRFDLASSWTIGTWKIKKDTIYFSMTPVYDTIVYKDNRQTVRIDSLVLSLDQVANKITSLESIAGYWASGGQNQFSFPDKLFFRRNKLFKIINGKLIKEKTKGFWGTNKKYIPWYVRISK